MSGRAIPQTIYEFRTLAIGTNNGAVPFWMRSNKHGSIPLAGGSTSFLGRMERNYNYKSDSAGSKQALNWGMAIEGRINTGIKKSEFILTEGYLRGSWGPLEMKVGRWRQTMGFTADSTLTIGSFALSGNALGIPMLDVSIPNYFSLPFLGNLFAFKGNLAHGWLGDLPLRYTRNSNKAGTYIHQKSIYGRLGSSRWRINVFAGFNHQVFWGNEERIYGKTFKMSKMEELVYIGLGKPYGNKEIPNSKIGNHLGTLDFGLHYVRKIGTLSLYRQNFYDVGAMFHLANLRDGLMGLSYERHKTAGRKVQLRNITVEFLATKDQAGELTSKITKSGDEDYYNNYIYASGWSYKSLGLGNPLITQTVDARKNLPTDPLDYFNNNRVLALNLGLRLAVEKWYITSKLTGSRNYGTYGTSNVGRSRGQIREPIGVYGIFVPQNQFSSYVEIIKSLSSGYKLGCFIALDKGGLLPNSFGTAISMSKTLD